MCVPLIWSRFISLFSAVNACPARISCVYRHFLSSRIWPSYVPAKNHNPPSSHSFNLSILLVLPFYFRFDSLCCTFPPLCAMPKIINILSQRTHQLDISFSSSPSSILMGFRTRFAYWMFNTAGGCGEKKHPRFPSHALIHLAINLHNKYAYTNNRIDTENNSRIWGAPITFALSLRYLLLTFVKRTEKQRRKNIYFNTSQVFARKCAWIIDGVRIFAKNHFHRDRAILQPMAQQDWPVWPPNANNELVRASAIA